MGPISVYVDITPDFDDRSGDAHTGEYIPLEPATPTPMSTSTSLLSVYN